MTKKFAVLLLAALACACAGPRRKAAPGLPAAGPRPDWADGPSAEFPRARYLLGVGIADDQAAAMERARGEIARVFSARVTVNSLASASESTSVTAGGAVTASSSQDVRQAVRSTSQKVLEGVEIVRGWREPGTGSYYSLAVLDRAKAFAAMQDRLADLDRQAVALKAALAAPADKLAGVKAALNLRSLLKARGALAADMRVLSPGQDPDPGFDPAAAASAAAAALARLDVAVVVTGDGAAGVRPAVLAELASLGIDGREAASADGADIAVNCEVSFAPQADPDPASGWKWCRGEAAVTMKDVKSSRVFLSAQAAAREASASAAAARSRAEASLGRAIAARIGSGLDDYFRSLP